MLEYQIVFGVAHDLANFQKDINAYLSDGWRLVDGGLNLVVIPHAEVQLFREMVKGEEDVTDVTDNEYRRG